MGVGLGQMGRGCWGWGWGWGFPDGEPTTGLDWMDWVGLDWIVELGWDGMRCMDNLAWTLTFDLGCQKGGE